MNKDQFIKSIEYLKINYTNEMINKLDIYCNFLLEYNSHTNLTAIRNEEDVYLKHFYDSLTITKSVDLNTISSLIDIGTGAGFPGVVLKIFFPHLNVVLLDSNNKKTTFLTHLINKLSLNNINVVNERAEDYAKNHLNEFDLCTSRAVAFMDVIVSLSMPLIKKEGQIILMKGSIENEKYILERYQQDLNISKYSINSFYIGDNQERNIVIINKNNISNKLLTYSQILKRHDKWSIYR